MSSDTDDRPEVERLRERLDAAIGAIRILGREVRSLRAEVEALRREGR